MKRLLVLLLFSNILIAQEKKELPEIFNFGSNPGNLRMFMYHIPPKDSAKVPLVLVLHGCNETANSISELTGWNKLADIHNFALIYPQQKIMNNPSLCFNWFLKQDIEKGQGECESIYQMIAYAKKYFAIDSNRIYITGLSAGAVMSVAMLSTHPETFKVGAIFAGGPYKLIPKPINTVKMMLGKMYLPKDKLVNSVKEQNPNYKGAYPDLIIYQGLTDHVVNHKNAGLLVNQWTGLHKSDTIPDKVEPVYKGITDITRFEYTDSLGKPKVVLYEVSNLGHKVLVKPGKADNEGGKDGLFSEDKGYHSTYHTAREFGLLKK